MGYQFIHEECYGREAGKTKTGGNNIKRIIDEVVREHGAHPHVFEPQKPKLIFGIEAKEVEQIATLWGAISKDDAGRKLRIDAPCLLAGVISIPDGLDDKEWEEYKELSILWLQEKYGDRFKSAIEHTDEEFRHFHYYVIPEDNEKFDSIHSGKKMAREARQKGLKKSEQNAAYIAGMRAMQDDFYLKVASKFGLTRFGPKRRRLTRAQWQAEQHNERLASQVANARQAAYDEAYAKGLERGYAEGHEKGLGAAGKLGTKLGTFVANAAKSVAKEWHQPTKEAKLQVSKTIKKAKKYVMDKSAAAEKKLTIATNENKELEEKLARQKIINDNLTADYDRLQKTVAYDIYEDKSKKSLTY